MAYPIEYFHYTPAPTSFIEMVRGAMKAMTQCAGVKEGENVVIACDTNKMRMAEALASAAYAVGGIPTIVCFTPTGAHGRQVPKPVVGACAKSDVFFFPTTWSMTHTDARIEAVKNGARGCTMCEATEDALCTGGILGDYAAADKLGRTLGAAIAKGSKIRMTSPDGTDLTGEISGRPVQYETGIFTQSGDFASLPNSEINISPIEGSTEGVLVANIRVMGYGALYDEKVVIEVKEGLITKISGGHAADYLRNALAVLDDKRAYNFAEFGIGLNPHCRVKATNQEDLGHLGHGHHGIGSNYAIGGNVAAPCHIDVAYSGAVVEVDGVPILDNGKLLI
ncbi:MAG: hypothetical protein DRP83_01275 [Planctomycetota bacterium]|nr:MAG: hypothetical protein DRP83_01275 [Planctomycetota bacterium]